jgi:hypothetical protein
MDQGDMGETGKVLETKIGAEPRFRSRKPYDESCYLGNPFLGFARKLLYT